MPTVTACATLGYAAYELETAVKQIAARGFSRVEITELGSYCRHFPYQETSLQEVKGLLAEHGLTPVAMNVSASRMFEGQIVRPSLSDPETAEYVVGYVRWFLEHASALGVKVVTFPIGKRVLGAEWAREMAAASAVYRRFADMAAEFGISLNLEVPHLYQLIDTVEHVKAVFEAVDHPSVGATVDSSHWGIIGYDLDEFLPFLGPRVTNVHLRDSAGQDTRDFKQDLELTPGRGTADFAKFGAALDRAGYRGNISMELEYRFQDMERIENEFDAGIRHLKRCGWHFPEGVKP
jgi:sugar phosphate isomerase/epimerase